MLDFLEADWNNCIPQGRVDNVDGEALLQESLLWQYIAGHADSVNRSMRRRIIRSILAAATPESLKEYPEVWEKETVEVKQKKVSSQPLGEVDFETGEVADYDSDEEMEDESEDSDGEGSLMSQGHSKDNGVQNVHDAIERLGGQDAIQLRHRLIAAVGIFISVGAIH